MAHVVILSLVFPPDNVSTAHIMAGIASDLQRGGHQVRVVTTTPHYHRDARAEKKQPLRPARVPLFFRSVCDGVPVLHVQMPLKEKSNLRRAVSWLKFHILSTAAILVSREQTDVILCPSPPLTIGISAWVIGLFRGSRFIYNVQEIYPDIAINLGVLKSKWLIRGARRIEQFVYRKAAAVSVIAPRMQQRLTDRGVPSCKLHMIPNFVDLSELEPSPKDNPFSREHGVTEKFVVNYSGNIGPAQGVETLLEAATILKEDPRIHFVITGDGTLADHFRESVRGQRNVTMLGFRPFSEMSFIYGAADAAVVSLALSTGSDAVPSKVYRIMACARAVLAVADPASDLASLIRSADCGRTIAPGRGEELAELLRAAVLQRDEWTEMGERGYDFVSQHHSREKITGEYQHLVQHIADKGRNR
jgi:colanic acid biosynthesis glycosyl transferase WcaI